MKVHRYRRCDGRRLGAIGMGTFAQNPGTVIYSGGTVVPEVGTWDYSGTTLTANGTTVRASRISGLVFLDASGTHYHQLVPLDGQMTISGASAMLSIELGKNSFAAANIGTLPPGHLNTIVLSDNPLVNAVVIPPLASGVFLQRCSLTQAAVDSILSQLVANGVAGGQVSIDGSGNAAPSVAGIANATILTGRGWTVVKN